MPHYADAQIQTLLKRHIRTIPDYPKSGILFRDITTLLCDGAALAAAVDGLCTAFADERIDAVAGIEARGFILGGAIADRLRAGFVPIRKAGKLPAAVYRQDYQLEYGEDAVELHRDALAAGARVLLIDDLIATGGTAKAAVALLRQTGADVAGAAFVIDLPDLGGSAALAETGLRVHALCAFEGV